MISAARAGTEFSTDRGSWRDRLATTVLRPSAPPLGWGIAIACGFIASEMLVVHLLEQIAPNSAFGAVFLFGVLVVSAGWGFGLALVTSVASATAYAYVHVSENSESLVPAVVVFSTLAILTNVLVGQSRLRAVESDQRRREADLLAAFARTMLRESMSPEMFEKASSRLSDVLELPPPHVVLGPAETTPAEISSEFCCATTASISVRSWCPPRSMLPTHAVSGGSCRHSKRCWPPPEIGNNYMNRRPGWPASRPRCAGWPPLWPCVWSPTTYIPPSRGNSDPDWVPSTCRWCDSRTGTVLCSLPGTTSATRTVSHPVSDSNWVGTTSAPLF